MESRTLLDYALFQLTPTRTRCDLVIYAGKKSEKLASGLLDPFLSHLKSAKDQISKGGYSITLQPISPDASWFTKATLERFVRFVSTPEVLERFVTIEREIGQIESSIVSNEQANETAEVQGNDSASDANFKVQGAPSKLKVESSDDRVDEPQEKPKVRLQRVLESRKAILKKEQAMAYARALVAGFEMDCVHDLVSFSDAFGALRLREACINFAELCNKKNDDKIWMDEVAAMQACSHSELSYLGSSGIILASENNSLMKASAFDSIPSHGSLDTDKGTENGFPEGSNVKATEGMAQGPTWANHLPHYMQNFQSPVFQQIQPYPYPYPGYVFPGMQVASSHYPDNMLWPSNFQDSSVYLDRDRKDNRRFKSFTKKEKFSNNLQSRGMKHGEGIETKNSSSGDSSDNQEHEPNLSSHDKMHNKKRNKHSSRKVVIRNINYIASGRNGEKSSASGSDSSDEDDFIDADSLKQQVEEAVGSLKRHQKPSTHQNKVQDGSRKTSNKSRDALDEENVRTTISKEEKKDGNWDIFQNLLMRDADSRSTDMGTRSKFQEECFKEKFNGEENLTSSTMNKVPKGYASDAFLLNERSTLNEIEAGNVKFEDRESFRGVFKISSRDEELLIPSRAEAETYSLNAHFGTESSLSKSQKEEDWIKTSQPGQGERVDHAILFDDKASACYDDHLQVDRNKRDMDDSFMVQSRLSDNPLNTPPKTDIFMVSDIVGANQSSHSMLENLQSKVEAGNYDEPNDLYMVLGRDSTIDHVVESWKPDMEYENSNSLAHQTSKPIDSVEDTLVCKDNESNIKTPGREVDGKTTKSKPPVSSLGRSKSETSSRRKISALGNRMIKSKSEKEEEKTKKLEELRIQRQKRIAERSAAKGFGSETSRALKESKKNTASAEIKKLKPQDPYDKNKPPQKLFMRNSTINRLATARTTDKQLLTESKRTTPRESSVMATPSMKKTKGTRQGKDKVNPPDKETVTNNSNDNSFKTPKRDFTDTTPSILGESTSVEPNTDDKKCVQVLSDRDLLSLENPSSQMNPFGDTDDHVVLAPQITVRPTIGNNSRFTGLNIDEENDDEKNKLAISPEISIADVSTPPPNAETIPEVTHSRKKWNNGENFLKAPKGFRKLLLFGRKI